MNDSLHLHEGERLLCSVRSSGALLLRLWLRSLFDGVALGAVLALLLFLCMWALGLGGAVVWLLPACPVVAFLGSAALRYRRWRDAGLRVTTERILVEMATGALSSFQATIKWSQYQESHVERPHPLDLFFGSRTLTIRHGSADATRHVYAQSVRLATDLKHYLDKVDAVLRQGRADDLRPFVAKPRGQRD